MKKLILTILLVLMPVWAFGATVWVKDVGGDQVYYESGASSCDDVTDADTGPTDLEAALTAAGAGGILNICAGTYSGTELDAADGLDSTAAMTINAVGGTVILDGTGCADKTFTITHAITLNGPITITGADSGQTNCGIGANAILNDITFDDDRKLMQVYQSAPVFNRCIFKNSTISGTVQITGSDDTKSTTMNYCGFLYNSSTTLGINHGSTHYFNNCFWIGSGAEAISSNTGAQNVVVKNSLFSGNVGLAAANHVINNAVGVLTVSNSQLQPHPLRTSEGYGLTGVTDGGNNIFNSPKFVSYRYRSIIPITIDDYSNYAHWKNIADYALSKGMYAVFMVSNTDMVFGADWTTMAAYVAQGHEIASHSRHHTDLSDRDAFTVTYDGNPAVINISPNYGARTGVFSTTVTGGTGASITEKDLTAVAYDTVGELCTYINAQTGYTCTEDYASNYNDSALSITLAPQTNIDITGAGGDINLDQTNYFNEEIILSKSDIETGISGYTCVTFAYPYGLHDETAEDAVKNAGYLGAAADSSNSSYTLSNLSIFQAKRVNVASAIGTTDDTGAAFNILNIPARVAALADRLGVEGGVVALYCHTSGEYSLANWQLVIDALAYTGAEMITYSTIFDEIQNSGNWADADADGERWTRTFTDNSNYNLEFDSPAIKMMPAAQTPYTGVQYDLNKRQITDATGALLRQYGGYFSAGAYQYQDKQWPSRAYMQHFFKKKEQP